MKWTTASNRHLDGAYYLWAIAALSIFFSGIPFVTGCTTHQKSENVAWVAGPASKPGCVNVDGAANGEQPIFQAFDAPNEVKAGISRRLRAAGLSTIPDTSIITHQSVWLSLWQNGLKTEGLTGLNGATEATGWRCRLNSGQPLWDGDKFQLDGQLTWDIVSPEDSKNVLTMNAASAKFQIRGHAISPVNPARDANHPIQFEGESYWR